MFKPRWKPELPLGSVEGAPQQARDASLRAARGVPGRRGPSLVRAWAAALLLGLPALAACRSTPQAPSPQAIARAKEALGPFKTRLRDALGGAMAQGPVHAVEVCASEAPKLAADASKGGVRVGRVSSKHRNPANAPQGWRAEALADFAARKSLDGVSFAKTLPSGAVAYAEPIVVQPMCLTCHGEQVDEPTRKAIQGRYPGDLATGYSVGQLRGAFWAEVDP